MLQSLAKELAFLPVDTIQQYHTQLRGILLHNNMCDCITMIWSLCTSQLPVATEILSSLV